VEIKRHPCPNRKWESPKRLGDFFFELSFSHAQIRPPHLFSATQRHGGAPLITENLGRDKCCALSNPPRHGRGNRPAFVGEDAAGVLLSSQIRRRRRRRRRKRRRRHPPVRTAGPSSPLPTRPFEGKEGGTAGRRRNRSRCVGRVRRGRSGAAASLLSGTRRRLRLRPTASWERRSE